ncbi:MAG: tagaturonate reductase [Defluviitaleaceae bacterium]|nr:tagaturonate reductase [Defluviitaleaceae bacterium]
MRRVNETVQKPNRLVTVLQYGEGNFLRAFVDYMIDVANEAGYFNGNVQIVKAIPQGKLDALKAQDGVYTVLLRGKRDNGLYVERRVITSVAGAMDAYGEYRKYAAFAKSPVLQFVVSNTTEAGIVYDEGDKLDMTPPESFPGKLTKLLYERFIHFNGAPDKGLIILPCELIDKNGDKLLECCLKLARLWALPPEFTAWLTECNTFCNTLVDRIVTGYPTDEARALEAEFDCRDNLLVAGEPFAFWVIECKKVTPVAQRLPLDKAGLPVIFTHNLSPYRERKVRILNGAHTAAALAAYLSGADTVGDMMKDTLLRAYVEKAIYTELSPHVPLPPDEVKFFADSVIERFENPFIRHNLLSISLNSVSKFKVRVLPTIVETQEKTNTLPEVLCFSLAALLQFYRVGERDGAPYSVSDDKAVLDFFDAHRDLPPGELTQQCLGRVDFWDMDLTRIPGFAQKVTDYLQAIQDKGMRGAISDLLN